MILNCHAEGTVFPLLRNDPGGRILFLLISKGGRNFLEYQGRSKFYFMHCHVNVSKKSTKNNNSDFFFGFVVLNGTTFQGRQLLMRRDRKILSEVATNHIMDYANSL